MDSNLGEAACCPGEQGTGNQEAGTLCVPSSRRLHAFGSVASDPDSSFPACQVSQGGQTLDFRRPSPNPSSLSYPFSQTAVVSGTKSHRLDFE